MIKQIFHGSNQIVKIPLFGIGKPNNDYGMGFYCTEDLSIAKEWGVTKTANGYANIYNIDLDNLSILSLNSDAFTVLHWLAILLENRSFDVSSVLALVAKDYLVKYYLPNYKEYDVITGYRADDSYFSFAQDFINGAISVRQLANALRLGNLGTQFVLKRKKAFNSISFQR